MQVERLLRQGRFDDAVMQMECALLDRRIVRESHLRMLPEPCLQASPLLLEAHGEYRQRAGDLPGARAAFARALKGFAAQTFRCRMLSVMAKLADVHLRSGERDAAATLVHFLQDEYVGCRSGAAAVSRVDVEVFGRGAVETGAGAIEFGRGAVETGMGAIEFGRGAVETGMGATEFGRSAVETGTGAIEFGRGAVETGMGATEFGRGAVETGTGAIEFGQGAVETGMGATEFGRGANELRGLGELQEPRPWDPMEPQVQGQAVPGEVPHVLAKGQQLLTPSLELTRSVHLFREAADAYKREERPEQSCQALLDLILYSYWGRWLRERTSDIEAAAAQICRFATVHTELRPYAALAEAVICMDGGRWEDSLGHLQGIGTEGIPYFYTVWAESLQMQMQMRGGLRKEEAPPRSSAQERLIALGKAYPSDLVLQVVLLEVLSEGYEWDGRIAEAKQTHQAAEALRQALRYPELPERREPVNVSGAPPARKKAQEDATAAMHSAWRIQCFGGLKFTRGGVQIHSIRWKRRKAQELFIYLVLQPEYACRKEQLMDMLWPDEEPSKAVNHLYVTIHQLKRTLQEYLEAQEGVILKDGIVRLNETMVEFVDVEQYLAMLRVADQLWAKDREIAMELYREAHIMYEDLLTDIPFMDWLTQTREFLTEKQAGVIRKLGQDAEERKAWIEAETYFGDWIRRRPYQEEAYQCLIRLLMRNGRKQEARRWYDKLTVICQEELSTAPSIETTRMLEG